MFITAFAAVSHAQDFRNIFVDESDNGKIFSELLKEVEDKNFRLDLYHRLGVIIIHVPSLNERREDVPLLVDYFLDMIATEYGQPKKAIDQKAMDALQQYNWTGNIRELRNVVERLIILSAKTISLEDVENYVLPKK